jgi:hypothetical protein
MRSGNDFYGNQITASEAQTCDHISSSCDLVSCHKPSCVCSSGEDAQGNLVKSYSGVSKGRAIHRAFSKAMELTVADKTLSGDREQATTK